MNCPQMRSRRRKHNAEVSAQEWIKSNSGDPPGFSVKPVSPLIGEEIIILIYPGEISSHSVWC